MSVNTDSLSSSIFGTSTGSSFTVMSNIPENTSNTATTAAALITPSTTYFFRPPDSSSSLYNSDTHSVTVLLKRG